MAVTAMIPGNMPRISTTFMKVLRTRKRIRLMQYATASTKITEITQVKQAMMNVVPNILGKSSTLRSVNSTL